jgi:maleate cis-trans isomerase
MRERAHRAVLSVPANNSTMEPELKALCPELSPILVARVRLPAQTLRSEDLAAYSASTLASVVPFLTPPPELVVHGCTAAGFLAGPTGTAQMVNALRQQSGAAVVSTATAMIEVLRHDRVTETAVVTPYLDSVNRGLRCYLESAGISIETLCSFESKTTEELGQITEEQVFDLALRTVTPRSQALFIACSQLPTLGIIEPLREQLGIPVWSSIRATAWAASRAVAELDASDEITITQHA